MSKPWAEITLDGAGQWLSGGTPSKQASALWEGSLPWVSPKDMKRPRIDDAIDHVAEAAVGNGTQLAPVGSLLMVVRGMILAHTFPVALTTGRVTFNQDIKALVPGAGWSSEFLLQWLQFMAPEVGWISATGVTQRPAMRRWTPPPRIESRSDRRGSRREA